MTSGKGPRGGIDVGGTKIQAVVVDGDHNVLGDARHPTPTEGGPADVVKQMADALSEAAGAAGIDPATLVGIGVGSPGVIDDEAGTVSQARNLPDWAGTFEVGKVLGEAIGAPVALGNDVSVATDAEFELGAAKEFQSILGVFWGTGVGGGIILNGERWDGRGAAGEIGHVVVKLGGRQCPCGRHGCMEAYAGRGSMEARARKLHDEKDQKTDLFKIMEDRGRPRLTSSIWARALEDDDKMAHEIVDEAVEAIGCAVASALNVLDVEAVVIGGGLGIRLGEPYKERIEKAMMPHLFADERPPVIRVAALGDLGGAIGASLLVA